MRYKKIMLLIIILTCLLAVSAVSAAKNATEDIISTDAGEDVVSVEETTDEVISTSMDLDVLSTNPGNYSGLASEIVSGGNIELQHDYYTYDSGSTIKITVDNSVINGKGAVIDMAGSPSMRAFEVTASGVTIKNLTIKNANIDGDGGAIYFGSSSFVQDCNFINNMATVCGGAIFFNYDAVGTVINCNFVNNTATYSGGAICIYSDGRIENCNFANNKVTFRDYSGGNGGAVQFSMGYTCSTVINCNFTNNTASEGGAVFLWEYSEVRNCNFVNNTAWGTGGAVHFYSTFLDSNCLDSVENCNFVNNSALGSGGAIYFDSGTLGNVTNSNFNGNNASSGSAIFFNCSSSTNAISNSTFLNNNVNSDTLQVTQSGNNIEIAFMGQNNILNAIYSNGDVNITNVTYGDVGSMVNTGNSSMVISGLKKEGQNIFVTVVVNDILVLNTTKVTDSNGKIVLNPIVGNYTITASYDGDSYYRAETKATFNIVANETSLELSTFGRTAVAKISPKNATGNIIFIVKNESGIVKTDECILNESGVAELDLYGLKPGKYNIGATYVGNINYYSSKANINHEIVRLNSTILIEVENIPSTEITAAYNVDKTIVIILKDSNGEALRDAIVSVNLNGIKEYCTDNNGQINVLIKGLTPKTYVATIKYRGNENYMQSSTTAKITVIKQATKITAANITTTHGTNKNLTITLKNSQNSPLTNTQIIVDLGTGPKAYATDSNGQVKIPTDDLVPKTYSAKVTFEGNAYYMKSSVDVTVVVKKAAPKLTAKSTTFKKSVKTKKYTITLNDNKGKRIKNVRVTLIVNGKTYDATTNSKGEATFKIIKLTNGTYKAVIKFKGNKYYTKATKKVKLTVKIAFKTVSKGSKVKANVEKIQQALKSNGYYLTYKGYYLMVDGIYGDCTERSVREFQHDNGLKITGRVDEKTAKKLKIIN